jgi:hypothetical protein
MINRMPINSNWRRLRIALTQEEVDEYRTFIYNDGGAQFIHAIRMVPIQIEPYPDTPLYTLEYLQHDKSQPASV